jgi:hypothetical protein
MYQIPIFYPPMSTLGNRKYKQCFSTMVITLAKGILQHNSMDGSSRIWYILLRLDGQHIVKQNHVWSPANFHSSFLLFLGA